jgi:hypothetical protein
MSSFQETSTPIYSSSLLPYYTSPFDVVHDLVSAAIHILQDDAAGKIVLESAPQQPAGPAPEHQLPLPAPNFLKNFVSRFVLGLPLIGAGSLVHMLLSLPFLGPAHWLARYQARGRRRNNNSRDIAALLVVGLLLLGAIRHVN